MNLKGGWTLPRNLTDSTVFTPAHSARSLLSLDEETASRVVHNCRQNGVTFGHALAVLGHVAQSIVMLRRYSRGLARRDELVATMKTPMQTGGPLNLRLFLDQQWYNQGGAGEVFICISFFYYTLPALLINAALREPSMAGAPLYSSLLSSTQFFSRCKIIKQQAIRYLRNPLFLELTQTIGPSRIERTRNIARVWRDQAAGTVDGASYNAPPGAVFSFGGSSIGNVSSFH